MKIPKTYEEYKALTSDELFELGWTDFDEATKKNILNFIKRSMFEEKTEKSINENELKNISFKSIIHEETKNDE